MTTEEVKELEYLRSGPLGPRPGHPCLGCGHFTNTGL